MHLDQGTIRAYQDHQLDADASQLVEAHLASCERCQDQAAVLLAQAQRVHQSLGLLQTGPHQTPPAVEVARARLAARLTLTQKEHESMLDKFFSRISRPAWAAIAVVTLLAVSLAFPSVRVIANSFLGLFRVQRIAVVQVDPGAVPNQLGHSTELENIFSEDMQYKENGPVKEVSSAAEASAEAGIPVRLLGNEPAQPILKVQPGGSAAWKVNLDHVRAVLEVIGRSDIQLPKKLDGSTVTVDVPASVMALYGECKFDMEKARQEGFDPDTGSIPELPNCTTLVQMRSPTITAPDGLNVSQIGEAFLEVMGMSQEDATRFAQTVDWTSTFVVPIPRYDTNYQDVKVDGVDGSLIMKANAKKPQYMLMWVKDGIIYSLVGTGDASAALQAAGSLK